MTAHDGRLDLTEPLGVREALDAVATEWWLSLFHQDGGSSAPLTPGTPLVVGRARPADVVIDHPSLSRVHARFTLGEGDVEVEDLGSTNGTWLGGERVQRVRLRAGVELQLGGLTAVLHAPGLSMPRLGLEGHERFLALLDVEVVRARHFRRAVTLLMLRAARRGPLSHARHWIATVQRHLRVVDRVALYAGDVVEVMLPEAGLDEAAELARTIVGGAALVCGVSALPECTTTVEELIASVRGALQEATASRPVVVAERPGARVVPADTPGIVAESAAMKRTLAMAARCARGAIPVLLHGETGSGKEVVARFIHESSPRRERPLVAVNSGALPAQLVESTLFGHEKGAFTGASARQAGVFEAADGGTVFLDEIGELPLEAQASLLRVLEQKRITRVGSTAEIEVDVRVVAASHRNLEEMVRQGRFREDLLYRLNAVTLDVPPLRERRQDIAPLVQTFLAQANATNGSHVRELEPDAIEALEQHGWPGNVRELRNAVERAVLIAEGDVITVEELPTRVQSSARPRAEEPPPASVATAPAAAGAACLPGEDYRACMQRLETEVLVTALRETGWRQIDAAKRLSMPRRTLVHKIRAFGIKRPS